MRKQPYDVTAKKQTVSLTLNADLYAKAKSAGVNASQVAEEALAQALARHVAEQVKAEILQDLEAYNAYVAKHGSPAELARAHYAERDEAV
jgi:antitoxin CcdA